MSRKRNSGGDASSSKKQRYSSQSRQGNPPAPATVSDSTSGSSSDSSSSHTPDDETPPLERLPIELRKMIIGHIVPAFLPVRIHTYGGFELDLLHKVYLNGGENSDQWKQVLQFGLTSKDYKKETHKELEFLTKRGVTHICADLRGDLELFEFPSLTRPENRGIVSIPNDVLDQFKEIRFVVPWEFGTVVIGVTNILVLAEFTFAYTGQGWTLSSVQWAPLLGYREALGGPEIQYWKDSTFDGLSDLLDWHQDTPGISIPLFQSMIQIIEEESAGWLANYTFNRGISQDLRTFLVAFYRLPGFVNQRASEKAFPNDKGWTMRDLRQGVQVEFEAKHAGNI